MTQLIYCADGNPRFAKIALEQGFLYGAQLPNSIAFPPQFVDNKYKEPNRGAYMKALKKYHPKLATVLDWSFGISRDEIISWSEEAAQYVSEALIIIPKIPKTISSIPREIGGKPIRLGYSVPTSFGASIVPLGQFVGWPLHLLGGSPSIQLALGGIKKQAGFDFADTAALNIVSADGNYHQKMAIHGQFFANGMAIANNKTWPRLTEVGGYIENDVPYHAFRLSCINIKAAWNGCRAMVRYAKTDDIPAIKQIGNQYKNELGFVNSAALQKSITLYSLYVAEYQGVIVGFVNFYRRRDDWNTIYEIAVHRDYQKQGMGRALLEAVPTPRRLKCTVENPANDFYRQCGMVLMGTEQGKNRRLNVWQSAITSHEHS